MRKIILLLFVVMLFGCAAATVEQSIKKLTYQKDALTGADTWVIWRVPTFQFRDELLEEYEINSYLKCMKSEDNYTVSMTTQSGAEPVLEKYEIVKPNGESVYLPIGNREERQATLYKGDEAHLDIYNIEFFPDEIKVLTELAQVKGLKIRPISVQGDKFVFRKLSGTEMAQIGAILSVCKVIEAPVVEKPEPKKRTR